MDQYKDITVDHLKSRAFEKVEQQKTNPYTRFHLEIKSSRQVKNTSELIKEERKICKAVAQ